MKLTHLTLASSIFALAAAGGALANGAPADCCDKVADLEARVDRLDAKAVEGTTKKILLSGHVNRAIWWADNGNESNTAHVDNYNSSSRLNVHGFAKVNDDMKVGLVVETGYNPNSTLANDVQNAQDTLTAGNSLTVRVADVYFHSKGFGTLTLGHGHMASDRTMEDTDLSGTRAAANGASAAYRTAGGVFFLDGLNVSLDTNVWNVFDAGDGLGRHDRVRYDSPSFYGFSLSASHGYQNTGDLFDLAAKFAGKFMGVKVAAQVAVSRDSSQDDGLKQAVMPVFAADTAYKQINGSVGVLLPFSMSGKENTGVSLHFATAHRDWRLAAEPTGHVYHGKIGFQDHFMGCGKTAVAVDYGHFENMFIPLNIGDNFEGKTIGVTAVQHIDKAATEVYAAYRHYDVDVNNVSAQDVDVVTVGARVKF